MSRSRRKTPICGWTTCDSEKEDKSLANRRLRRIVGHAIKNNREIYPELREVSDVWNFGKDGKQRLLDVDSKEMRK
jgi:hypothetical protein